MLSALHDLKNPAGVKLLKTVCDEANELSNPKTADIIEALQETLKSLSNVLRLNLCRND